MSYRNDHDAALARVDALERELATLRERVTDEQPRVRRRRPWLLFTACLAALTAGVVGGVALGAASGDETKGTPSQPAVATFDRGRLDACGVTGTCREELYRLLDTAPLSAEERVVLGEWAAAEEELAGAESRRDVYFANDPYALDGYSTARQVGVEYDRAVAARERAMTRWQLRFAQR